MQAADYAKMLENNVVRALKIDGEDEWAHQQCLLQRNGTIVTAAHHLIWRHLYVSIQAATEFPSLLRLLTKETRLLWKHSTDMYVAERSHGH